MNYVKGVLAIMSLFAIGLIVKTIRENHTHCVEHVLVSYYFDTYAHNRLKYKVDKITRDDLELQADMICSDNDDDLDKVIKILKNTRSLN